MNRLLLFVFGIALAVAGCAGEQPAVPSKTCAEYCPALQHAACAGAWEISGTYPSCTCTFVCPDAVPVNQTNNQSGNNGSVQQNQSVQNQSVQNNSMQNGSVQPPVTNKTIPTLLTDSLDAITREFYGDNDGRFDESIYRWIRDGEPVSDDFGLTYPASDVKFSGMAIDSIAASGFIVFGNVQNGDSVAYGLAIFKASETPLDNRTTSFSVDYAQPLIKKNLRNCRIYGRDGMGSPDGYLLLYHFKCEEILDK